MDAVSRGPFRARTLVWIVAISVGSFILTFVMTGFGDDLAVPRSAGADTFSFSAVGYHALRIFLERSGVDVSIRRTEYSRDLGPGSALVVAEPRGAWATGTNLDEVIAVAADADASVVLVLPKWAWVPDRSLRHARSVTLLPRSEPGSVLGAVVPGVGYDAAGAVRRLTGDHTLRCAGLDGAEYDVELRAPQFVVLPEPFTPVVQCDGMALVAHRPPDEGLPEVWLVADPDVLNNHGLARADHALMVHRLFRRHVAADRVVFDEVLHGFEVGEGLVAEMLRFPLVVPVLHGVLLVAIVAWAGGERLGRPRPVRKSNAAGKQVLLDNAAQLLERTGRAAHSLQDYFELTLRSVGSHFALPNDLPLEPLRDRLQGLSRSRGLDTDLLDLERRLRRIDTTRGGHADRVARLADRLYRWREEMLV